MNSNSPAAQRKVRNFLLDAHFQLRFTAYVVILTIIVAGVMGVFLWRATRELFRETEVAVDARSKAAEKSHEVEQATLTSELARQLEDPDFERRLKLRSEEINRAYDAEKEAIEEARKQLVRRQQVTAYALVGGLMAFVFCIGFATIITTHKVAGPLFRIKRMAQDVANGHLRLPAYGLRPSDEMKELFEVFTSMVAALRGRTEEELRHAAEGLAALQKSGASDAELRKHLEELQRSLQSKLE